MMSCLDSPERDLVDELLGVEEPVRGDRVRPRLLAETTSVVRRRRIARRLGLVAALAGCYLAGVVTAREWKRASNEPDVALQQQAAPDEEPGEGLRPVPERPQSPAPRPRQPVQRPHRRRAARTQADFEQIRRVSDRFLYEQGNVATALHYYARALDRATPEQHEVSLENDSWLLMALKQARKQENRNDDGST